MRKFLAALLTLCLALTLAAPIAMAEEKVTITFAFWDTNQEPGMKAIAEAYMAEHPNVTVETQVTPWSEYWTKLEAAAQGGALPDVFWMHSNQFFKYVSAGMLLDLTDLNLDYTPYPEGITALYHYEDKQWPCRRTTTPLPWPTIRNCSTRPVSPIPTILGLGTPCGKTPKS